MLIPLDPDTLEAADRFVAELVVVIAAAFNAKLEEARKKKLKDQGGTFQNFWKKLIVNSNFVFGVKRKVSK